MPKGNLFPLEGEVIEIEGPKRLPDGSAEVATIVVKWMDGNYLQSAAVNYYAKGDEGLKKLKEKNIKVGDMVSLPFQPKAKLVEGIGKNGPYRFYNNELRGDSWQAQVSIPAAEAIEFPGGPTS